MTKFKFYNNAVIGRGHSSPNVCGEISAGFYIVLSYLCDTDHILKYVLEDNSGFSYFIGDEDNITTTAVDSYYRSLSTWIKDYEEDEVQIERVYEILKLENWDENNY